MPHISINGDESLRLLRFTGPAPHRLRDACLDELERALDECERAPPAALLILGATGDFLAGADLAELLAVMEERAPAHGMVKARRGLFTLRRLQRLASFTICYIDGHCLGGGLDLALHCDARWVSPKAALGHPGIQRHFFTGWGGTELLARLPGGPAALLSGEIVKGDTAVARGWAEAIITHEEAAIEKAREAAEIVGRMPAPERKLRKELWLRGQNISGRQRKMLNLRGMQLLAAVAPS